MRVKRSRLPVCPALIRLCWTVVGGWSACKADGSVVFFFQVWKNNSSCKERAISRRAGWVGWWWYRVVALRKKSSTERISGIFFSAFSGITVSWPSWSWRAVRDTVSSLWHAPPSVANEVCEKECYVFDCFNININIYFIQIFRRGWLFSPPHIRGRNTWAFSSAVAVQRSPFCPFCLDFAGSGLSHDLFFLVSVGMKQTKRCSEAQSDGHVQLS